MWENFKQKVAQFLQGRNGVDDLSTACLIGGIAVSLLGTFTSLGLFSLMGIVLYFYCLFRIFSKNVEKRREENRKYLGLSKDSRTKVNQFILRRKNSKEYKYFRCPGCHQIYRGKRGSGQKHIVCKKCGKEFDKTC